jgi:hypothetical protein
VSILWTWGLSLILLTTAIHTTGIVVMALVGLVIRNRWLETRPLGLGRVVLMVIGAIILIGPPLAALHMVEGLVWAAAYVWLGALDAPQDAILYSFESMSTLGASGLTVQPVWRMMGALEAANGMLLFGISTAYIFAVMQAYWPLLSKPLVGGRHP